MVRSDRDSAIHSEYPVCGKPIIANGSICSSVEIRSKYFSLSSSMCASVVCLCVIISWIAIMLLRERSLQERPCRYAAIVWSRTFVWSTAAARRALTVVSRKESRAWRTEIGRLSVVPGLLIRVRPVSLRLFGSIRVVRIMGIILERA